VRGLQDPFGPEASIERAQLELKGACEWIDSWYASDRPLATGERRINKQVFDREAERRHNAVQFTARETVQ
jgi:hypothetical protein